jgi:L-fucose isomerase-like protein
MATQTTNFAVFFGNRGFFPESLIASARADMAAVLKKHGYGCLMLGESATRFGAVETPREGELYARFLAKNVGKFDGVILCLPNFGDETGAVAALLDAGVPVMVQAYPDELDKMHISVRRDAFCGKFSVMDVFCQYELPFSAYPPHVSHPASDTFAQHLERFAQVCRVVKGMRRMTVGAIGARTTAFKTVRFDELALQRNGITTETMDLSQVIARVNAMDATSDACRAKAKLLKGYTNWDGVPEKAQTNLAKLGVVVDQIIEEAQLDAVAIRCWLELEEQLGIAPCVILSELNNRHIPAACELDVCNAVAMRMLMLASQKPAACLDWNNNYGEDEDKCILFHCGPIAQSLMTGKGQIVDHPMFAKALGPGHGFGPNQGRITPSPMTFASSRTHEGALRFYLGEGAFTDDPIPEEFFGCAGVARIEHLQDVLQVVGFGGYRHHVSATTAHVSDAVYEAAVKYLGYDVQRV